MDMYIHVTLIAFFYPPYLIGVFKIFETLVKNKTFKTLFNVNVLLNNNY